eukprot:14498-Hanusia_phi.AAC.1
MTCSRRVKTTPANQRLLVKSAMTGSNSPGWYCAEIRIRRYADGSLKYFSQCKPGPSRVSSRSSSIRRDSGPARPGYRVVAGITGPSS